ALPSRLLRIDESKAGLGIEEPADEPGRGDAVDMDALSRGPGSADVTLAARAGACAVRRGLELREEPADFLPPRRSQEIAAPDVVEPLAEPRRRGRQVADIPPPERADFVGQLAVFGIALGARAADQLLLEPLFEKFCFADIGLAAAACRLLGDPLEVLEAIFAGR